MISIQKIQHEQLCSHHSLPFTHVCVTRMCQCQIKLCQKCCTEHQKDNQNSNILRMENYQNKIQTEIQIYHKQLESNKVIISSSKAVQNVKEMKERFQKFSMNQVKVLEQSMKYLNEQGANVVKEVIQASDMLCQQIIKINKKRNQMPEKYSKKLIDENMIPTAVEFLNQKGFNQFRKKLDKMFIFKKIVVDFLQDAQKYGCKYENFMKVSSKTLSNENSMKRTITEVIPKLKKTAQKSQTEGGFYPKQQNNINQLRANNFIQNVNQQNSARKRRATTIFGKK